MLLSMRLSWIFEDKRSPPLTWLSTEVVVVACLSRPSPSSARSTTEHRSWIRARPVADPMPQLTGTRLRRTDIPPRPFRPIAIHCTITNTRDASPSSSSSSGRKWLNKTVTHARIYPRFPSLHPLRGKGHSVSYTSLSEFQSCSPRKNDSLIILIRIPRLQIPCLRPRQRTVRFEDLSLLWR